MGTVFAPTYATLVMGYIEQQLYEKLEQRFDKKTRQYFEENWLRFLDDCFIIHETDLITPTELLTILNNLDPFIKFTMELSEKQLPFLDIMIHKDGEDLWMSTYTKPTDSKRYVPFNSCHPKSTLKNIPFSLARRTCMIVEKDQERDNKLEELRKNLSNLKYPKGVIDNGIMRAKAIPQADLRKSKEKKQEDVLTFISTNNPCNPEVSNVIKSSLKQIKKSEKWKSILNKNKFINGKRQPPNLGRLLCKSKYINIEESGVKKCGKNCACCEHVKECTEHTFKGQKEPFVIKSKFNCQSSNFIYGLTCPGCNEEYVGQTSRTLYDRTGLYRQHIRDPTYTTAYVERHLRECGKGKFSIFPILQINVDDVTVRETIESKFIEKFNPVLNRRR